jgi:cholesterol transport system auxiliary component
MTRPRTLALALAALSLSACVTLLPKTKPAQLYRFGESLAATAAAAKAPPAGAVGVYWLDGAFQQEAASDRILTVTGDKAAYIGEARWVAAAETLFDQAAAAAFDGGGGHVRLASHGAPTTADFALRLDVREFETRYASEGRSPTVSVRVHATLTRGRGPVADQMFEAAVPAGENRVTAIAAAYDKAVTDVLTQVVAWTNAKAA